MQDHETQDGPKEDPYIGVRTEIARVLGPSAFPGNKGRLIAVAKENGADDDTLQLLLDLPADDVFENTQAIIDALPQKGVHPDTKFEA